MVEYVHVCHFLQIANIQRMRLSRIICDAIPGMRKIQRDVFRTVDVTDNPLVDCDQLPDIDLETHWTSGMGTHVFV